ncbi:hypothetical protein BU23DRAFT_219726 [Bimuria novae-zelandiae CBS 107.79]|uniref:Uncharacterized protein n=1 Tax=Bimuria novae-zelandiae CBS 107.79 TaxID=1447943 RepID=A0A6A5UZ38_9PLEO|nr:hypothetical protein BU23DRAFT_219726 [Bimuria novae-zelandiae CBS 107.79]
MVSYHITEPHPSAPSSAIYYGRGGAGNITRVPANVTSAQDASGPASRIKLTPPPSNALFTSGRGGAGNMHREKERAMFSFDEELAQQERLREHAAPVYHVGRGGAGNLVEERVKSVRQNSTSSSGSEASERSVCSSIEGAWLKVSRGFSRN